MKSQNQKKGFTLIELVVSTLLASIVLAMASSIFLFFNSWYLKNEQKNQMESEPELAFSIIQSNLSAYDSIQYTLSIEESGGYKNILVKDTKAEDNPIVLTIYYSSSDQSLFLQDKRYEYTSITNIDFTINKNLLIFTFTMEKGDNHLEKKFVENFMALKLGGLS